MFIFSIFTFAVALFRTLEISIFALAGGVNNSNLTFAEAFLIAEISIFAVAFLVSFVISILAVALFGTFEISIFAVAFSSFFSLTTIVLVTSVGEYPSLEIVIFIFETPAFLPVIRLFIVSTSIFSEPSITSTFAIASTGVYSSVKSLNSSTLISDGITIFELIAGKL